MLTFIQAYPSYLLGSEAASLSGLEVTQSEGIGPSSILSVHMSRSAVFVSFCMASL